MDIFVDHSRIEAVSELRVTAEEELRVSEGRNKSQKDPESPSNSKSKADRKSQFRKKPEQSSKGKGAFKPKKGDVKRIAMYKRMVEMEELDKRGAGSRSGNGHKRGGQPSSSANTSHNSPKRPNRGPKQNTQKVIAVLRDQIDKESTPPMDDIIESEEEPMMQFKPGFHESWDGFIPLLPSIPESAMLVQGQWGTRLVAKGNVKGGSAESLTTLSIGRENRGADYWITTRPCYLDGKDREPELVCYWDHQFMPMRMSDFDGYRPVVVTKEWVYWEAFAANIGSHVEVGDIFKPRWFSLDNEGSHDLRVFLHSAMTFTQGLYRDDQAILGFQFNLGPNRLYSTLESIRVANAGSIWTVTPGNNAIAAGCLKESIAISDTVMNEFLVGLQAGKRSFVALLDALPNRTAQAVNAVHELIFKSANVAADVGEAAVEIAAEHLLKDEMPPNDGDDPKPPGPDPAPDPDDEPPLLSEAVHVEEVHKHEADHEEQMLPFAVENERSLMSFMASTVAQFSLPVPTFPWRDTKRDIPVGRIPFNVNPASHREDDLFEWASEDRVLDPNGDIVPCNTLIQSFLSGAYGHNAEFVKNSVSEKTLSKLQPFVEHVPIRKSFYHWPERPYVFYGSNSSVRLCTYIIRSLLPPMVVKRRLHPDFFSAVWLCRRNGREPGVPIPTQSICIVTDSNRLSHVANMPGRSRQVRLSFNANVETAPARKMEFFTKTDETLSSYKPRGLHNVDNFSFWRQRPYIKAISSFLSSVRFLEATIRGVPVSFTYGAEMTPEQKGEWLTEVLRRSNDGTAIFLLVGGDDTLVVIATQRGIFYVETDLSKCDQSHSAYSLSIFEQMLLSMQILSPKDVRDFVKFFKEDFYKRTDIGAQLREFLRTGVAATSLFNSFVVGIEELDVCLECLLSGDITHETLAEKHALFGRQVKVQVFTDYHQATFHKGSWVQLEGRFHWFPLPSRMWKFGITDIQVPDDKVREQLQWTAWSWTTMHLDPIFHAFINPFLPSSLPPMTSSIYDALLEEHVPVSTTPFFINPTKVRAGLSPFAVADLATFYRTRYHLSTAEVEEAIDFIRTNLGNPTGIAHPILDRIMLRDSCDTYREFCSKCD